MENISAKNKNKKSPKLLTEGSVWKSLMALSIPIVFANILQTAYQLTDTFWVGRLGVNAVAAVSISFPIIFLMVSLGGGLAMAGTILVAQYKGKNDQKATDHVASQTMLSIVIISFILSFVGYLLSPALIRLMGAEADVLPDAVAYMQVTFIGIIFLFIFAVYQSLMRGVGDVKTPLYIVLFTVLLNLILDPLFIFGYGVVPAFGVSGAAVATIGTQGIAAIVGLYLLINGRFSIHMKLHDFVPDYPLIKKMLLLGLPASIEQSTRALGMTIMTFLVAGFGTVSLAAYGIGSRILSFIIIPALGLSMATSTLVGQNIGAGKLDRAIKTTKQSIYIGFSILTLVGVVVFLLAEPLSALFIPGEPEAIASSALFIRFMALTFGFISIQMSINGTFRGAGDTFASMMLSIISLWVLQFPIAYVLSHHTALAEVGIWIAFPASNIIAAVITVLWFCRGSWKDKQITEEIKMSKQVTREALIEEGM